MKNTLIYLAIKYQGDFNLIQKAIQKNENVDEQELQKIKEEVSTGKIKAITILDKNYPTALQILQKPPFVLFYRGNIELLDNSNQKSALIGEQYNSKIQEFFNRSLDEIIKRHTLITNGYQGVEQKVMEYYRLNEKPIIGVSANGVSKPWMFSDYNNYEKILLISEYPDGVEINQKRLIERNRIAAALANFLVIYSIRRYGGSQSLVNFFLDLGKEIYCFFDKNNHDFLDYQGCSELIDQGANWITEIKDIYYEASLGGK
ncbi:DNA-processing protein DprA [Mycoplasma sp. 'Moose RK']|uniref:DNA-processing protein DprA n=1 Tax=Mycoplasma sp. 'Moose RK' TaxID=2780095 RepID=UPI0018C21D51|nr:DNA-processing protein DprA [Mycoplasma sp. 'Moose RK']MBG0730582.1 DNA-protecting protein DprA [Mycoplasma sp. 'Moose RK']